MGPLRGQPDQLLHGGLNDAAMFKWYVWTNLIIEVGPASLWAGRRSRHGTSLGVAIIVLLSMLDGRKAVW